MALGRKTGGRRVGTPNKRTLVVSDRFEQLGLDPIQELACIARDSSVDIEIRARILMDLMGYLYPKRKALDSTPSTGREVVFNIGINRPTQVDGEVVDLSKVDALSVEPSLNG